MTAKTALIKSIIHRPDMHIMYGVQESMTTSSDPVSTPTNRPPFETPEQKLLCLRKGQTNKHRELNSYM